MKSKIPVDVFPIALLLAANYLYEIIVDPQILLVLSIAYIILFVNLSVLLKNMVSTGLTYALIVVLVLNTTYSLFNLLGLTSLIDVPIATLLLITIAAAISKGGTNYSFIHTPVALIIGIFTGIAIGVDYPLRYSALGFLDVSLSQLVNYVNEKRGLFIKTLIATTLYTSPVYLASVWICVYNVLLFIMKSIMIYGKARLITCLDIVFKPLVYGLRP